jgi:hypothetical protein
MYKCYRSAACGMRLGREDKEMRAVVWQNP